MTAATLPSAQATGALRTQRLFGLPPQLPTTVGALGYGSCGAAASGEHGVASLDVPVLGDGRPALDLWLGAPTLRHGRTGCVRWCHDGHWLHGCLDIADAEGDLAAAAQRAYGDVFGTLRETGYAHLVCLWNYLPRINDTGSGLERYRQFNIGRQQAFIDSGHSAFEGAPAACALGTAGGALSVRFLAGRSAPLAVENPRQVPAWRYPSAYGPRAPTFSRAALADMGGGEVALWVSGTASIVGHESRHAGDVCAQTTETVANLHAVIQAAQAHTSAALSLAELVSCVYVRHAADAPRVREVLDQAWGPGSRAAREAVLVQADICRADLLVEVEGHQFATGRLLP